MLPGAGAGDLPLAGPDPTPRSCAGLQPGAGGAGLGPGAGDAGLGPAAVSADYLPSFYTHPSAALGLLWQTFTCLSPRLNG